MNKLATLALTMAFSFGGASTALASNTDDKVPQTKDLSVHEMNSTVGAGVRRSGGRIYWKTKAYRTYLFQRDGHHSAHKRVVKRGGWYQIGKHYIKSGKSVFVRCKSYKYGYKKGYTVRKARFRMPFGSVYLRCY